MKKRRVRDKFIIELQKTPIVQVACDKLNISRQTYYRWRIEDKDFEHEAEIALSRGSERVSDVAESNILRGIQNGDKKDSKFWLTHRHRKYMKPFERRFKRDEPSLFGKDDLEAVKKFEAEWFGDGVVFTCKKIEEDKPNNTSI